MINIVRLYIAIDFDGTIFEDEYPKIGKLKDLAKEVINAWYARGHRIIIYSCREGVAALAAEDFLRNEGINYHCFNTNHPELIRKYDNDCRKIGADVYIDDKCLFATAEKMDWTRIYFELEILEKQLMEGSITHGS